jgi:hypothetical protein
LLLRASRKDGARFVLRVFKGIQDIQNEKAFKCRGYTCLWRKIWSNTVLAEPDKRFSRLEAWLYITNVLAAGKDDQALGLKF